VFAGSEGALGDLTLKEQVYLLVGAGFFLLLIIAIGAGLFGWRTGAHLTLVGLTGHLLCHLAVGATAYRRVMARPWPEVPPLGDDEEW